MISLSVLIRSVSLRQKALGFHIGWQAPDKIFDVSDMENLNFHIKDLLVFILSILYHKQSHCQYFL